MPNTKAAKKALRSSLRKRQINKIKKYKIKNALKELRVCLAKSPKKYEEPLSKVYSALDKAAKSNFIPKDRVARKKSRVAKMVDKALETTKK